MWSCRPPVSRGLEASVWAWKIASLRPGDIDCPQNLGFRFLHDVGDLERIETALEELVSVNVDGHLSGPLKCRETFCGAKLVNEPDHLRPGHHPGSTATARDLVLSLPAAECVAAILKELLDRITISCLPRREPANTVLGDVFLYELLLIADDEENRLGLLLGFAPLQPRCFGLDDGGPRFDRVSLRCVLVAAVYPLQADAEAVRSAKDRPSGSVEAFTDLRRGATLRGHLCEYRVLFGGPLRSRRPDHASTQTMQEIQKAASDRHITRQAHWLLVSG